ncbi:copper resistance protein CopC [Metabacillus sediminilitoris]|uniref:Uncharacterized protein n=1 Tax=Metabacillus sediminilitoris TaxID=2567941 RepID=A0A4S4BWH6_9BACI|nr:copper resistance protein CopC [Metabacillus sediminilitoris]QGQ46445.1 hypothetical protein GMB29_15175 [Metabacillus sediminilitoris]THF77431.1 hypothetical protein E6W99_19010 [Metabacillus sediminilitoris]
MKKIMMLTWLFLAIPFVTLAHTTVSNSNPNEGEIITEELSELSVEFAGQIENQGSLTLIHDQEEIPLEHISIEEKKISGDVSSPLENGSYTLIWKIASTDGHLMTGDIPFTINKPEAETGENVQKNTDTTGDTEEKSDQENTVQKEDKQIDTKQEGETEKDNSSLISLISIIVLVILLAAGLWILFRKKGK